MFLDEVLSCLICKLPPHSECKWVLVKNKYFFLKIYIRLLQTEGEAANHIYKKKDIVQHFSQVIYRNAFQWRTDENPMPKSTLTFLPWFQQGSNMKYLYWVKWTVVWSGDPEAHYSPSSLWTWVILHILHKTYN